LIYTRFETFNYWLRTMTTDDKRQHLRINALNLISYSCIDETGQTVAQGMGRTLNVCEGGILLETHVLIDPKHTLDLAIGLKDDIVNIKGRVVYSKLDELIKKTESALEILKRYIEAFREHQ